MRTLLTAILGTALFATSAHAMEAVQKVEREVTITQPDGTQTVRRVAADEVKPGDYVVYTLDFVNTQAEPATDLVLAMPVPTEIRFVEGSADRPDARVEYSADGGKTFADRLGLTVRGADGMSRPADTNDITAVRWTLSEAVAPGETGSISFKGQLR